MTGIKLDGLIQDFRRSKTDSTILVGCQKMEPSMGQHYAVLCPSGVSRFVEKPGLLNNDNIVNYIDDGKVSVYAGPLICNKTIFRYIEKLRPSERGELEIVDCINLHKLIMPYFYDGMFFDIGSEQNYANAIMGK